MTHDELVAELAAHPRLRDKGKVAPAFYFRSKAFLHFHGSDDGVYADVKFDGDWERVPATDADQREALLHRVVAHLDER